MSASPRPGVLFARRVYNVAAIYGIAALLPQYFMEQKIGRDFPPPVTHPEHFYGFVGVALVWQFAFLLIARDPQRYRPLMAITVLEKVSFGVPVAMLFLQARVPVPVLAVGAIDILLASLFATSFLKTAPQES
jgi:hypothetical protein